MDSLEQNTKEKILKTSLLLFARKGLAGTSIRDIAQEAGVNVAAINYHFQNKQNLFDEVIKASHRIASEQIRAIYETKDWTTEELALEIYALFIREAHHLRNNFRVFTSEEVSFPPCLSEDPDFFGPPGGKYLYLCLKKEVPGAVADENFIWAIRVIFQHIVMNVLGCGVKREMVDPRWAALISEEATRLGIVRLVSIIRRSLREELMR